MYQNEVAQLDYSLKYAQIAMSIINFSVLPHYSDNIFINNTMESYKYNHQASITRKCWGNNSHAYFVYLHSRQGLHWRRRIGSRPRRSCRDSAAPELAEMMGSWMGLITVLDQLLLNHFPVSADLQPSMVQTHQMCDGICILQISQSGSNGSRNRTFSPRL